MLFACIFAPCFVVQSSLRCEPQDRRSTLSGRPFAIFDGPESMPRVVAVNESARVAGVEPGITKAQAAQCPGIALRARVRRQEQAAQDALLDCAAKFSPRAESTSHGVVCLDIEGTERIFGPPQKLLRVLADHAARVGLQVNVAAAANRDTALLAAKGFAGATVVGKGNEAETLARLSVAVLPLSAAHAETLEAWGIRTCCDLAQLPTVPLVERLGQAGLHLQRLARGEGTGTLVPVDRPLKFEESVELDDAIEDLESLAFILGRLLEQISERLASRSLATDEVIVRLQLDKHEDREVGKEQPKKKAAESWVHTLRVPIATQDATVLLKLLHLDLAQRGPGAAVKGVSVEARPARRRHAQAGLFAPAAPEPEKLEIVLARMRGVVGETDERGRGKIGAAEVLDSHRPDDFRMAAFQPEDDRRANDGDAARAASLNMSIFRPPMLASVRCVCGQPVHISFSGVSSTIAHAAGPWITSGNWWKDEEWQREEWDVAVQIAGGVGLYRIFLDLRRGAWFVEGLCN
jgi:protein ImuB